MDRGQAGRPKLGELGASQRKPQQRDRWCTALEFELLCRYHFATADQIPIVRRGHKVRILAAWVDDPQGWVSGNQSAAISGNQ
jgi:hypothetical protein